MRFETLKTNCARAAYNDYNNNLYSAAALEATSRMIKTGKLNKYQAVVQELRNEAYAMIMRTDVRNIKVLSDQFPNIVPSWVKSGRYTIEFNENQEWELINLNTISE